MYRTKLSKAILMAVSGTALLTGAASTASAHTMYNTFLTVDRNADTDGWTHTGGIGNGGPLQPWVGVANQPFGYAGAAHLNWAAELHDAGDQLEISQADAEARYTFSAEIDTAKGAWKDATGTGWKHQTDLGLIKSEVTQKVSLNLTYLGSTPGDNSQNFGITVFEGMDTTATGYSHHGGWNNATKPETTSNPFYGAGVGQGMTYLTHDATVDTVNALMFTAEAGKVYTIALGGSGGTNWFEPVAGYKLSISTAPVPVPAAVWLLGSALAGFGAFGRRGSKGSEAG